MNQKDIIRMAHEACILPSGDVYNEDIMEFARLIAADCAKRCDERAMRCEAEAQRADEAGERDAAISLRATAWQVSLCAEAIREAYKL